MASPAQSRIRDAGRSREAILTAAERLFAERGFDATSLAEIGAASGLSRATPSYFFGSKERLYRAVLERVFADRQAATAAALAPVRRWCESREGVDRLRGALAEALEGYMSFLLARPAFARLLAWEELAGGERLRAAERSSTALTDAFTAVRAAGPRRGVRRFAVADAVLLWVALAYAPLANRATLLVALERDLADPATRRRHVRLAVDQLMLLLADAPRAR